jgi:hypothetical protein
LHDHFNLVDLSENNFNVRLIENLLRILPFVAASPSTTPDAWRRHGSQNRSDSRPEQGDILPLIKQLGCHVVFLFRPTPVVPLHVGFPLLSFSFVC